MRLLAFASLIVVLGACGGKLSDEQRQRIKEDMKQHKIMRVTDVEITEAAFKQGREVMKLVKKLSANSSFDSLSLVSKTKIKWVVPGAKNALDIENQLIEAYLVSSINGGIEDNVQRLGTDSLLYTLPVTEKQKDGSENVTGMWSFRMAKKDLILAMDK